jgi:hypothetical protein
MKQLIRIAILILGLAGTYVSAEVQQPPTPDGGIIHPPSATLR